MELTRGVFPRWLIIGSSAASTVENFSNMTRYNDVSAKGGSLQNTNQEKSVITQTRMTLAYKHPHHANLYVPLTHL